MADDVLAVTDDGAVRRLTFGRPDAANAFNEELYLAVAAALDQAAADDGVSVVVVTGEGRSFCAGTDLKEMADLVLAQQAGTSDPDAGKGFITLMDTLVAFPKPLLAAVNGTGVGLGLTMLGHCDVVLIDEGARLLPPFTAMGVVPEAASSYLLPARMGRQFASLALLASRWITAEEAVAHGLALRTCPSGTVVAETMAVAAEIAVHPVASLVATKALIAEGERDAVAAARAREDSAFAEILQTPQLDEGILGRLE